MKFLTFMYAYFSARLRKNWNRRQIEAHQEKRRKKIISYAQKHSLYFAKIYHGLNCFDQLPILSKKEMMEHFSSYNTRKIDKQKAFSLAQQSERDRSFQARIQDISIGLSSGTSGNRGIFLTSPQERALWAGTILAKTLPRSIWHKTSIGLFLRANNQLYQTLTSKHLRFIFFDLQKPFHLLLEQLEKEKPKNLVAPPSVLRMIAEHKLDYFPEKIFSCAETLDPIDENIISSYFGQKLHQIYQCTEGFLAATCEYGTLHINEDIIYMEKEYIDQSSRRFVPIITDLYRTAQPIIRYRLDDILIERKDPCPCGSHYLALEKIEGRSDDVFYFSNQEGKIVPLFPDFLSRRIVSFDERITEYQVIQKTEKELELYVSPLLPGIVPYIQDYFKSQGFLVPSISLLQKPLPRKAEDKLRRIIRMF